MQCYWNIQVLDLGFFSWHQCSEGQIPKLAPLIVEWEVLSLSSILSVSSAFLSQNFMPLSASIFWWNVGPSAQMNPSSSWAYYVLRSHLCFITCQCELIQYCTEFLVACTRLMAGQKCHWIFNWCTWTFLSFRWNVLSDMPWKQIKKLWTCPEGPWIFFWLKWISIKEVTRSENSTSPVCKGPGTLGTPSLICFKPKRQIIVLIWQPANSQLPSSRMHSISNIKLLEPKKKEKRKKKEKLFEWIEVRCSGKTLRNPWYTWQAWNIISVNAHVWSKFLIRWCFISKSQTYSSLEKKFGWTLSHLSESSHSCVKHDCHGFSWTVLTPVRF